MSHLISYHAQLAQDLQDYPSEYLEAFESAVTKAAFKLNTTVNNNSLDINNFELSNSRMVNFQVILNSTTSLHHMRDLNATTISKLVKITGIIVASSSLSSQATHLQLRCKGCGFSKGMPVSQGFSGVQLPRSCDNPNRENNNGERCPMDPFEVDHNNSKFVDVQTLKIQEAPDMVPVGELPKHLILAADR